MNKIKDLRAAYPHLTPEQYREAMIGAEREHFDTMHRFCGRCGAETVVKSPTFRLCPKCNAEFYPVLSPAIVVLVRDGERALLVHARNFKHPEMFSLVAGFVEVGESLEECVAREVMEETSLKIKNIKYYGSQSWPFPSQLMVAFVADYDGGTISFDDDELSAGGWFDRSAPPQLPTYPSISRHVIDAWLKGEGL